MDDSDRLLRGERVAYTFETGTDWIVALAGLFIIGVTLFAGGLLVRSGGPWPAMLAVVVVALLLVWLGALVGSASVRYLGRRLRGRPHLVLDADGLHGAAVATRSGRLAWPDVRAVGLHTSGPGVTLALAVDASVVPALDVRLFGRRGQRYRHEVMLPLSDSLGLLDAVQAGAKRWGALAAAPETLLVPRAQSQDERLAVIARGEPLALVARRGRLLASALFGLPLLAGLLIGAAVAPVWWLRVAGPADARIPLFLVLSLIAVVLVPLLWHGLSTAVPRVRTLWRGAPVWELRPDGLADPSGATFLRPVPWDACGPAYVWRQQRGGDHPMMPIDGSSGYMRPLGLLGRLGRRIGARITGGAVDVSGGAAGVRADEMAELLNAARRQWSAP